MYLIFDTETTGLPRDFNAPITDTDNWPRCVQIAWQLHDELGNLIEQKDYIIQPDGYDIPFQSEQIHGISTKLAQTKGVDARQVWDEFAEVLNRSKFVVGQNITFDINVMGCELYRYGVDSKLAELPVLDTCTEVTAELCQIPGGRGGKFKLPTLTELHAHLFGVPFAEAHNATADVEATTRCFLELIRKRSFTAEELRQDEQYFDRFLVENPNQIGTWDIKHLNLKAESAALKEDETEGSISKKDLNENLKRLENVRFTHLHNHTQFSILQSTTTINDLIAAAAKIGSPAVAITDIDNMMAAFQFVNAGDGYNKGIKGQIADKEALLSAGSRIQKNEETGEEVEVPLVEEEIAKLEEDISNLQNQFIKPIVGCELWVCKDRLNKSVKDNGQLMLFLAKNKKGYHNLAKLASAAHIEGKYYVPRIDKSIIPELKEDIIVTTGGLDGEIPQLILNVGEQQAEEAFVWWHEQFGDDFYVELNRHGLEEEELVNKTLLKFAEKYGVKYFAANNNFYINKADANAHDILLCIKDGEQRSTPIGKGRGFRFGFPNDDFYFKTQEEMKELFADLPEAIECTEEIVAKIEAYTLGRDVLLPAFDIPEEFQDPRDADDPSLKIGENNYLRHLTYVGAEKRYGEVTPDISERLDFELATIKNTGYPGYFLIVQDFIAAARDMGVSVGPGRGSAAGSAVAYCIGITNVDPIKYDLLFERFLNPERVSMPDIDIDFDDEGRGSVIQYVIDKYGANQVAQIITYGTMAAKSSIRDAGRVLELPLPDTDRIAKLVPDMKLNKMFAMSEEQLAEKLNGDQMKMALELREILESRGIEGEVVRQAKTIEGSMRTTGIHACGVIITPSDIREHVPVALAKDSEMWSTQFDNSVVESAGLLKMDFLGLKTLTLIKDTLKIVKARHGLDIDIEKIPIDDEATYELFQRGETVGIFQYESTGMQKYLKDLKPTEFSDLIAMNALYRPGPLEYIPLFVKRKHGIEPIEYDLPAMEEYLQETYGITVYQEQVMLLSQKLAGFTKGEADTLRKAMGKKQKAVLDKMKPKFIQQGGENGHDATILEKVWKDWEAFASYAFNKSHSTCYAWIAYQTAYLKAHYPAEYMAAVLSNNMNDIKTVTFFMEECRRMGLKVLGPDVNESYYKFAVNDKGEVRFGMGGIKGVGQGPVKAIIDERKDNGPYTSFFDMVRRVSLKDCNKRVMESLAYAGAFDGFGDLHRAQYFGEDEKGRSLIENSLRYGTAFQTGQDSNQVSLFDMAGGEEIEIPAPGIPNVKEWSVFQELSAEKEVVGIYISGHPMDDYSLEVDNFCDIQLNDLNEHMNNLPDKEFSVAGIISNMAHLESRKGNKYGFFELQDKSGSMEFRLFGETYLKLQHFLAPGNFLYVKGKVQLKGKKFNPDGKQKEYSVQYIELLSNIRERLLNKIYLRFDAAMITRESLADLEDILAKYEGSRTVYLDLIDHDEVSGVTLLARNNKVNVTNDFLKEVKEIMGYEGFSVNKSDLNKRLHRLKIEQEQMKQESEELVED
ncbi:MAG: DNA polymerase III subunit alpha [Flavobacteriales bacterium]|nr:DNA polymerase III subunit alpha [Flavobacteriales bacterium]